MRGYYEQETAVKVSMLVMAVTMLIFILSQFVGFIDINLEVTGQPTINSLTSKLDLCNEQFDVACPEPPKCDTEAGAFFTGAFFGVLLGLLLVYIGKYLIEDWWKELQKRKEKEKK